MNKPLLAALWLLGTPLSLSAEAPAVEEITAQPSFPKEMPIDMQAPGRAASPEVPLSQSELRRFLSRTTVVSFAPHGLRYESSRLLLRTGRKNSDGSCTYTSAPELSGADLERIQSGEVLTTVELAIDPESCQSVIERGFRSP